MVSRKERLDTERISDARTKNDVSPASEVLTENMKICYEAKKIFEQEK